MIPTVTLRLNGAAQNIPIPSLPKLPTSNQPLNDITNDLVLDANVGSDPTMPLDTSSKVNDVSESRQDELGAEFDNKCEDGDFARVLEEFEKAFGPGSNFEKDQEDGPEWMFDEHEELAHNPEYVSLETCQNFLRHKSHRIC